MYDTKVILYAVLGCCIQCTSLFTVTVIAHVSVAPELLVFYFFNMAAGRRGGGGRVGRGAGRLERKMV